MIPPGWTVEMKNVLSLLRKHKAVLSAAAAVTLLLFSCAGVPEQGENVTGYGMLPATSDIIISADVQGNRILIEPVLDAFASAIPGDMAEEFITRTDRIWAGIEIEGPEGQAEFKSSIVAGGNYPRGLINWALCWDPGWQNTTYRLPPDETYQLSYWASGDSDNQIAVPGDSYLLASSGRIGEMLTAWAGGGAGGAGGSLQDLTPGVRISVKGLSPEEYAVFIPELKKAPIDSLEIFLEHSGEYYILSGEFRMDGKANAMLFTTLFRALAVAAKDLEGNRLFPKLHEIKIDRVESSIVLGGMKIPEDFAVSVENGWLEALGIRKD